jgi:hypothetical protein
MMELKDLDFGKPVDECTDDELVERFRALSKLRIAPAEKKASGKRVVKSNEEKRLDDLIKKLPPDKLKKFMEKLNAMEHGGTE